MTDPAGLEDVDRELTRVVDRLTSMPLAKAGAATGDVQLCARVLVRESRELGVPVPDDAVLPDLGPSGLGAMIAVLGRDWLDAARSAPASDTDPVLEALVTLRRALP